MVPLSSVWAASAAEAWAGGVNTSTNQGVIYRWNGSGWTVEVAAVPKQPGLDSNVVGLWGSSASDVWAVTADGKVLHRSP